MKNQNTLYVALVGALLSLNGGAAFAAELGMPAPALSIHQWVKGDPVDLSAGKGKKIHVVEFWATWCPPCRASIPHLTEVQKRFKDQGVVVVGISDEPLGKVKPFVAQMGDKMAYTVALDKDKQTSAAYMKAFQQGGIPHAFIVDKESRVAWHGHPMAGLDQALEEIVAGTYDLEVAKRAARAGELIKEYFELVSSETLSPKAEGMGETIVADGGADPMLMNEFAWTVLTHPRIKHRDLPLALKAAEAAYEGTDGKDAAIADTYARALFDSGRLDEAVKMQARAVTICTDARMRAELEKNLKTFQTQAAK